jgi:hypothetical protein
MGDSRFSVRDLLGQVFQGMGQVILVFALIFAPIMAAPYLIPRLDRAGLPSGLFVGLFVLIGPVLAVVALRRERSSLRRSRAMRGAALDLGLRFSPRLRLPRSMRELPSLVGLDIASIARGWTVRRGFADLISGTVDGTEVLILDYWVKGDGPYAQTRWHTMAATRVGDRGRTLLVEPRSIGSLVPGVGLQDVGSESGAFGKHYRIRAKDPKFASAFLDARMIEFLLQLPDPWTFEVGGTWLAVPAHEIPAERLSQLIGAQRAFRSHVPRVIESMYPEPGPTFA